MHVQRRQCGNFYAAAIFFLGSLSIFAEGFEDNFSDVNNWEPWPGREAVMVSDGQVATITHNAKDVDYGYIHRKISIDLNKYAYMEFQITNVDADASCWVEINPKGKRENLVGNLIVPGIYIVNAKKILNYQGQGIEEFTLVLGISGKGKSFRIRYLKFRSSEELSPEVTALLEEEVTGDDELFFQLEERENCGRVEDATAHGGKCGWFRNDTKDWFMQWRWDYPESRPETAIREGIRYISYAVVKVEKLGKEGVAFRYVIYDRKENRILKGGNINAWQVENMTWQVFRLGDFVPKEGQYISINGAANKENIPNVYVDRIYFIPAFYFIPMDEGSSTQLKEMKNNGDEEIVIENRFLKLVVSPSHGGRIKSLVCKPTSHEYTIWQKMEGQWSPGIIHGGLCHEIFGEEGYPGEAVREDFQYEIAKEKTASVKLRYEYKGKIWKGSEGLFLEKTISISENSPVVKVKMVLKNLSTEKKRFTPWIHNNVRAGLKAGENIVYFTPTVDGVNKLKFLPGQIQDNNFFKPGGGWHGVLDTNSRRGIIGLVDEDKLYQYYYWLGNDEFCSFEWMYNLVTLGVGEQWETEYWFVLNQGFTEYTAATRNYIIGLSESVEEGNLSLKIAVSGVERQLEDVSVKTVVKDKEGRVLAKPAEIFFRVVDACKARENFQAFSLPGEQIKNSLIEQIIFSEEKQIGKLIKMTDFEVANRYQLTSGDEERGYVLYQKTPFEKAYYTTLPGTEEVKKEISIFASPGEYEPATFSVYSVKNLKDVKVTVGDLKREKAGNTIPKENIDIHIVKVWEQSGLPYNYNKTEERILTPELLLKDDSIDFDNLKREKLPSLRLTGPVKTEIAENSSKQFWLTVRIPQGTVPGIYEGELSFSPGNALGEKLKLKVDVLPVRLEKPGQICGIYYRGNLNPPSNRPYDYVPEERQIAELKDIKEHGFFDSISIYEEDIGDVEKKLKLLKDTGFQGSVIYIASNRYDKDHLKKVAEVGRKFRYEILVYLVDEPTNESQLDACKRMAETAHALGMRTTTALMRRESAGKLKGYLDIPIWNVGLFLTAPAAAMQIAWDDRQMGYKESWYYWHPMGEHFNLNRLFSGYFLYKSGFTGIFPYNYQHVLAPGFPYDDWSNEAEPGLPAYRGYFVAYPSKNGPVPTLQWEACREGIDDLRYLSTLDKLLLKAEKNPGLYPEVKKVRGDIQVLLKDIDSNYLAVSERMKPGDFQKIRQEIVKRILKLQELLGE